MRKIIICVVLVFAAVSLIYGLSTGSGINSPTVVMPMLLAFVMAIKSAKKKAG